ncbi:hypothetical protein [Aegicerativicinus sediminis]|uniref:hypothetical protein n=1 Tax=Aegicerativicinus sediminis TaxID=2893202 RepID=UPI001E50D9A4|nr:hypothetical protein [Aegicerativicinus sediminis]
MKNLLYIIVIGLLLFSCSSSDDGGEPKSTAPSVPQLIYPGENELCIDNAILFKWSPSTVSQGNSVSYKFQVAENSQFTVGVVNKQTTSTEVSLTLEKGKVYFWRVMAFDSNNSESEYSSVYSFFTESNPDLNYLPFLPNAVNPLYNTSVDISSVVLKWTAEDPDFYDTLTYDIYLDIANPPTNKISGDQSESSLDVSSTVQAATTYYWQVVVKDNKGGQTQGQIWKFNTN